MFIVYSSNDEVLVTTPEKEDQLRAEYFGPNNRNPEDYDRTVTEEPVIEINSRLNVARA